MDLIMEEESSDSTLTPPRPANGINGSAVRPQNKTAGGLRNRTTIKLGTKTAVGLRTETAGRPRDRTAVRLGTKTAVGLGTETAGSLEDRRTGTISKPT